MSYAKTELFSEKSRYFSMHFRALGHPARVDIMKNLEKNEPLSFKEILDFLPYDTRQTVSDHISTLLKANLIKYRQFGGYTFYETNKDNWLAFLGALEDLSEQKLVLAQ